ncbi:phage head spike fiber domain-containing protein [Limimaricola variabilis]
MTNLPTIYKDAGGIGALPGDNVRMLLDTNGLELGPETIDGSFSSSANWSSLGAGGWSIVNGQLVRDSAQSVTSQVNRTDGASFAAGKWYSVSVDVIAVSGIIRVMSNTGQSIFGDITTAGAKRAIFYNASAVNAQVLGVGSASCTIDNLTIRELPGIHADQPSTSLQPVLGRSPVSRRNLLAYSEDFSKWNAQSGATAQIDASVPPLGKSGAVFLLKYNGTADGRIERMVTAPSGALLTYSVWLRVKSGTLSAKIGMTGSNMKTVALTTEWQRFEIAGSNGVYPRIQSDTVSEILAFGAQVELGPVSTAYQKVAANGLDIAEPGVPSYSYLRFDAVDDKLPQVYPSAKSGDLMIFGRKGSWIDPGVSVTAGGTLNAISGKDSPKTFGIIPALGDIVAWYHAPQTLNAYQRAKLIEYFRERGAKGLLVPSGIELVTNGAFNTDVSGWAPTASSLSVQTGAMRITGTGTNGYSTTSIATEAGQAYRMAVNYIPGTAANGWLGVNTSSNRDGGEKSIGLNSLQPGVNTVAFVASGATSYVHLTANGVSGVYADFDNVSVQKLVIA